MTKLLKILPTQKWNSFNIIPVQQSLEPFKVRQENKSKNSQAQSPSNFVVGTENFVSFIKFSKINTQNLIPIRIIPYATRTKGNVPLLKTKHNFFENSFFPTAIIEWNNLDPNLKNSKNISVFKEKYLISYDLPQILFLIFTILKESNLLQDLDLV